MIQDLGEHESKQIKKLTIIRKVLIDDILIIIDITAFYKKKTNSISWGKKLIEMFNFLCK